MGGDAGGWLRRLLGSSRHAEEEIGDEIRFHIEGRVEELVEAGWDRGDARREVLRRFGDPGRVASELRRLARGSAARRRWREAIGSILRDVRYALRGLRRNPGFTSVALLTLALGIGATTAIFSVLDAVVLRPLPFHEPDRLVLVFEQNRAQEILAEPPSPPNYADWVRESTSFEAIAALADESYTLTSVDLPRVVEGAVVSPNLFQVLGVDAALGRTLGPGDARAGEDGRAVISHALWQEQFGGDSEIVGRTLSLNGRAAEIVGVMPPSFDVPRPEVAVWVPRDYASDLGDNRQSRYLTVIGRMKPDVTPERAAADLNRIHTRLGELYPEANRGWSVSVVPAHEYVVGDVRGILLLLFGAVGFVLLIACANVASLVLGRSTHRHREMAVRAALGAGRRRLRSQLLTESLVLGLLGGILGTGLAHLGVRFLLTLEPGLLPRAEQVGVDLRVLGFTLAVSLGTGLACGFIPGLRTPENPVKGLREGAGRITGMGSSLARRLLVAGEVAISVVLLAGAALLVRSFDELRRVDPGFDAEGVHVASVSLSSRTYPENSGRVRYFGDLAERLREVPGVAEAGVTTTLPLTPSGIDFDLPYRAQGHPDLPEEQLPQGDYRIITPGALEALGIEVVRGRGLRDSDRAETSRVLLVNEAMARRLWPGEEAVGKTIEIHYITSEPWQVVGVVEDTRHQAMAALPSPQMFVPLAQADWVFNYMQVVVKEEGTVPDVREGIRDAALEVDRDFPLYALTDMETILAESLARDRFLTVLLGTFAALALILSAAGIYGVVSYQVARRTREIGVRMALGADRSGVLARTVGEALVTAGLGALVGVGGSLLLTRLLSGLLYEVSPADPLAHGGVAALLLGTAALSAFIPARRAASVDPVSALKSEQV